MAGLVIVAANVIAGDRALVNYKGTAGEALTRGQYVYLLSGKLMLADRSAAASANVEGVVLNDADVDQPVAYASEGANFIPGAAAMDFPGAYYLGDLGGAIPEADLGSGDYVTPLFLTKSATEALLSIKPTGAAIA